MEKKIKILKYNGTFLFSSLKNIPQAETAVSYSSSPGFALTICLESYVKEGTLGTKTGRAFTSSTCCILQTSPANTQLHTLGSPFCRCTCRVQLLTTQPSANSVCATSLLLQKARQSHELR